MGSLCYTSYGILQGQIKSKTLSPAPEDNQRKGTLGAPEKKGI